MSDQTYKHSSYHIIHIGDNIYLVLASREEVFRGSMVEAFKTMVRKYDIPADQIEQALLKMHHRDHNTAEFNMFGTFIATLGRIKKAS